MTDLIIIGGGPAGLAGAIYAARYNLKTKIITKELGGEMAKAVLIENYPGFEKISGQELTQKIADQVKKLGVGIELAEAKNIEKINNGFEIITSQDKKFQSKKVLYVLGLKRKKLNIPGEKEFSGRGVSFCVTCDGPLFKNKIVAVAGGGDAGLSAAWYLSDIAKKVFIIEIMPELLAEPYWKEKLNEKKNIEILTNTKIKKISGEQFLKSITIKTKRKEKGLQIDGLFVEIGAVPKTKIAEKLGVKLDSRGQIIIDSGGKTNIKGFYAAGDTTTGSDNFNQILTAMSEGAIAAHTIYQDLRK